MEKKARLGRGLDALFGADDHPATAALTGTGNQVVIDQIDINPFQPRKTFDDDDIRSLSETIKAHGVLQPLVVRQVGERFQLIAGERRLRAARAAGLPSVPVNVVDFNDQQVLEAALVENIHRADLNPIEKAQGFREYLSRFQMTHEQLAQRLGLGRTSITNLVSLLDLPGEVQDAVRVGQLSTGHAKLLKGVDDRDRQVALCKEIVARGLSVHATEALIKQPGEGEKDAPPRESSATVKTAHVQGIEDELRGKLFTKIEIRLKAKDRGQIVLAFESNDDFERLLEVLRR
jgi:ParB family transcriptional regulator, chromosome partitioning protein